MMYEHIVARLRETYKDMDASFVGRHFAIQFNIWGEGHGALYMEIKDGHIFIEPYEYFDRDTLISTDADTLLGIASGKINPATYGDLYVEGDFYALEILKTLTYTGTEEDEDDEQEPPVKEEKPAKKKKRKTTARKKAGTVKEKAEDVKEAVKEKAGDVKEAVKEKAETVKEKAEDAAEAVKEKAENKVNSIRRKV